VSLKDTACEAIKECEAMGRPISLSDDVLVGAQVMDLDGQPFNRLPFPARQLEHALRITG
jgi:hypothetical protein